MSTTWTSRCPETADTMALSDGKAFVISPALLITVAPAKVRAGADSACRPNRPCVLKVLDAERP